MKFNRNLLDHVTQNGIKISKKLASEPGTQHREKQA